MSPPLRNVPSKYVSYGLKSRLGGPIGDYIGFWGDPLRDVLQIQSRVHVGQNPKKGRTSMVKVGLRLPKIWLGEALRR